MIIRDTVALFFFYTKSFPQYGIGHRNLIYVIISRQITGTDLIFFRPFIQFAYQYNLVLAKSSPVSALGAGIFKAFVPSSIRSNPLPRCVFYEVQFESLLPVELGYSYICKSQYQPKSAFPLHLIRIYKFIQCLFPFIAFRLTAPNQKLIWFQKKPSIFIEQQFV